MNQRKIDNRNRNVVGITRPVARAARDASKRLEERQHFSTTTRADEGSAGSDADDFRASVTPAAAAPGIVGIAARSSAFRLRGKLAYASGGASPIKVMAKQTRAGTRSFLRANEDVPTINLPGATASILQVKPDGAGGTTSNNRR